MSPTAASPTSKVPLPTFQSPQQKPRDEYDMKMMSTQNRPLEPGRFLASCFVAALVASSLLLLASPHVAYGQARGPRRPGAAPLIPGKGPRDFDAQWSPANPQLYADW